MIPAIKQSVPMSLNMTNYTWSLPIHVLLFKENFLSPNFTKRPQIWKNGEKKWPLLCQSWIEHGTPDHEILLRALNHIVNPRWYLQWEHRSNVDDPISWTFSFAGYIWELHSGEGQFNCDCAIVVTCHNIILVLDFNSLAPRRFQINFR